LTVWEKIMIKETNDLVAKDQERITRRHICLLNKNVDVLRTSQKLKNAIKLVYTNNKPFSSLESRDYQATQQTRLSQ
jgi:exonuclease I